MTVAVFQEISDKELMIIFGNNITKYRKKRNMTQQELADKLNVSTVFLSSLENGGYGVQFKNIALLSNVLKVEPYLLFKR